MDYLLVGIAKTPVEREIMTKVLKVLAWLN